MREFEVQLVSLQKSFLTFILYSFRLLLYLYITGSLSLPVAPHSPHGKLRSVKSNDKPLHFKETRKCPILLMKFLDLFRQVGTSSRFSKFIDLVVFSFYKMKMNHDLPVNDRRDSTLASNDSRGKATSNKNKLRHSRRTEPHRKPQKACHFTIY